MTWGLVAGPLAHAAYLCPLVLLGLNAGCTISLLQLTTAGPVQFYDSVDATEPSSQWAFWRLLGAPWPSIVSARAQSGARRGLG